MSNSPRTHLLISRQRVACGVHDPARTTTLAASVTCGGCQRTIHMADTEVKQSRHPRV